MFRSILLAVMASALALGAAGCKHKCCRSTASPYPPQPFLPAGPSNIPPAGVPVTPPSGSVFPPASGALPPPDLSVPSPAPGNGSRPSPELILPDPIPGGTSRSAYPAPAGNSILGAPVKPPAGATTEPPVAASSPASTATTAGLPGFVKVKDGVATGRKPTLDGFDALRREGYRHVVYLHAAAADASASREVAEGRGLTFTAIETIPERVAEAYDAFTKAIADRPVYVFDDDGLRAGAMWYLHFRLVDLESAEVGKIRARSLGLKEEGEEAQAFWLAMQKFLAAR